MNLETILNHPLVINLSVFILVIIATLILGKLVDRFFKRLIERSTIELKTDPTNYHFLRYAVTALVYVIGFGIAIYAVPEMRTLAKSLFAGAGLLALSVGFASQHVLSNIISGFFIVIFKPFRVNDRLTIKNMTGVVEDITLRHTVIRDFENKRILIPNELISDEIIINSDLADQDICTRINIPISFDSDIDLAKRLLSEEIIKHPLHIDNRTPEQKEAGAPEVPVRVVAIGDFSVKLRAWAWTENASSGFVLNCDILEAVKKRFDKEGVVIPYPHTVVLKE